MKLQTTTVIGDATDADSIALSQTPAAAGNLTLTALAATGWTNGHLITFTSVGDISARVFTIYGTDSDGLSITDTVTSINTTGVTTKYFKTVTRIAVDALCATALTVGNNTLSASAIIVPDIHISPFEIAAQLEFSGTATSKLQYSINNQDSITKVWFDDVNITGKSAAYFNKFTALSGVFTPPAQCFRVVNTAWTSGTTTLRVLQSGLAL